MTLVFLFPIDHIWTGAVLLLKEAVARMWESFDSISIVIIGTYLVRQLQGPCIYGTALDLGVDQIVRGVAQPPLN